MPVRRPDSSKSGIIQVSREELDRWLQSRWSPRSSTKVPEEVGANHSNVVPINVAAARHLRLKHHELMDDVKRSLSRLQAECEALGSQLNCKHAASAGASSATESDRKTA
jgi:hypothetical protein